jgi:hypothetical protein
MTLTSRMGFCDELIVFPDEVDEYADISNVLRQVQPVDNSPYVGQDFDLPGGNDSATRPLAFAYFLGVMVGDMSKHASYLRTPRTMTALLQLSKRYQSNLRFGNFVAFCAALLGIRMKRIKDYVRPIGAPYDAYRWGSKQSRLMMWMFEKCLGLRQGQTTTNDPIQADWLKGAPDQFQVWFLQGVADSDGYVDLNKHEIGIVVDPNEMLIGRLLSNLDVRFRPALTKHQATIMMSVREGFGVPVFSPHARTHKFELAKKLVEAQRFHGKWPYWLRCEVDNLVVRHESSGEIVQTILNKYNIAIRSQNLK